MAEDNNKPVAKERDVIKLSDIFNWDPRGAFRNAFRYVLVPEAGKLFVSIGDYILRYLVYDSGSSRVTTSDGRYKNYGSYSDNSAKIVLKPKEDNRYDISRIAVPNRAIADEILGRLIERESHSRNKVTTLYDFYDVVSSILGGVTVQNTDTMYGWTNFTERVDIRSCPEGWYFNIQRPQQLD